jgi:hypothetical protein
MAFPALGMGEAHVAKRGGSRVRFEHSPGYAVGALLDQPPTSFSYWTADCFSPYE